MTHPLLVAVQPVVEAVGATIVAPEHREASDVPLVWNGEVLAVVRMPPLHGALDRLIDSVEAELGGRLPDLEREDKQRAVRLLDERGAFTLRRAVEQVADAMGVSRITVYNYLNAIPPMSEWNGHRFEVIGFDADDTLWHSEDSFHVVEDRFVELISPYVPDGVDVAGALRATERAQLPIAGYGVKAFTLSMVQAAITVSDGTVPAPVIGQLLEAGMDMLTETVRLLPHVPEVLADLSRDHRLILITKGDLVHQTRKVTTSGLAHHFHHVEVVLEKDADTYARILKAIEVPSERFCMVGNSVRSDILPVLSLGAHAVHVPYPLLWEHEHVDHDEDLDELTSIAELPARLRAVEELEVVGMDVAMYHDALQRDAPALLTAASAADRAARIESCPEWTPADLVWHVGNVHAFFASSVRDRWDDPAAYDRPERPAHDEAVFDFGAASAAELLAVLPTADPTMLIQTRTGQRTVSWVSRRMAHETAVHRYDAERAAGHEYRVAAELASDGVDEYLDFVLPRTVAKGLRLDGSVHLHCTDVQGEWIIEPGDDGSFEVRREHTKGAAAVRGPAHELLMVLWRRLPLEAVDVIGDQTVAAQLVSVPI